jgi:hypothetical protein
MVDIEKGSRRRRRRDVRKTKFLDTENSRRNQLMSLSTIF